MLMHAANSRQREQIWTGKTIPRKNDARDLGSCRTRPGRQASTHKFIVSDDDGTGVRVGRVEQVCACERVCVHAAQRTLS